MLLQNKEGLTVMKARVCDEKQSPYKRQLDDVEKPMPSVNEVLLRVVSASINAANYRSMKMGVIPKKKYSDLRYQIPERISW